MLRTYIFIVLLIGLGVAMIGRMPHTGASQPNGTTIAVHSEDVAEFGAAGEPRDFSSDQ